jgi:uncharacterized protein
MTSAIADREGPVGKKNRIQSIDTLRGVALFGILIMNIIGFALPFGSYYNPIVDANLEGLNLTAYMTMDIFFEGSMRAIFSMLFGAGVILFTSKPDTAPIPLADLWFRRTTLLIVFGLINAYIFLWVGDILYVYGVAGLFLFMFRNSSPARLISYSVVILLILGILGNAEHSSLEQLRQEAETIEALPETIEKSEEQLAKLAQWQTVLGDSFSLPEQTEADLQMRRSGYFEIMSGLVPINVAFQTTILYFHSLWDAMAMMLLGMALFKLHCFDASRSYGFYGGMVLIGFGVALPVNYFEVITFMESGFAAEWAMSYVRPTYDIGRMGMAIGYIGLVMLICKSEILTLLRSALAAVGQMALTNYLSHSVICNFIFMGYGLGLVGQLNRYEIYYVVLGVWIFQLIVSPLWLRFFRFGPVEWLWRTLTYMQWQPMKITPAESQ